MKHCLALDSSAIPEPVGARDSQRQGKHTKTDTQKPGKHTKTESCHWAKAPARALLFQNSSARCPCCRFVAALAALSAKACRASASSLLRHLASTGATL